jgi:uncharacterized integral membrane protein
MEKGFILSLIFAAIIAIFALNNSDRVLIDLFFTEVRMSQAIIILISALFGAIITTAFSWVKRLRLNKKIKSLNQQITELDKKNKELYDSVYSKDQQIKALSKEIVDSPRKDIQTNDEQGQTVETDIEQDSLTYPGSGFEDEN